MITSILKRSSLLLTFAVLPHIAQADYTLASISATPSLSQQRSDFLAAERALKKNHITAYKKILPSLHDYPLTPHLEYKELSRRLNKLPYQDVDRFLSMHSRSYLGDSLLTSWLHTLARNKRWHEYQGYYQHHIKNVDLQCYYLRARLNNGEAGALDEVADIWNVGKSRPKSCDPLFAKWRAAGRLTDDIAWDRHRKALQARELSLAKYISKSIKSKQLQQYSADYRAIYSNPKLIFKTDRYSAQNPETKEMIIYGLKRASKKDPADSVKAWNIYDAQQFFNDSDRLDMQEHLAVQTARKGDFVTAEALLGGKESSNEQLLEYLIRASLRDQDWQKTQHWISKLPETSRNSERWRYWQARTLAQLDKEQHRDEIQDIYSSLALTRSFYGFLAADTLGREYKLVDRPVSPPPEMIAALAQVPGMMRAREFLALNRINSARREWLYTTLDFDSIQMKAAGVVAQQWGWHRQGIQSMANARYWDDLQVRFPLAFKDQMETTAKSSNVEKHLLFAIARQESAFSADARSRVGAMGLMQLMPGTAKDTARKIGITYNKRDLLQPETNIQLGAGYLNQLLTRFDGNRILAAAAYNAGPNRVSKWLNNESAQLPYDVWIELIPYKETRHYVQNILAYSVIYGYRLDDQMPFIRDNEAKQML